MDLDQATQRSRDTWSAGDFGMASGTMLAAELLCEAVPVKAGQRVLDVATGTGNTAIAAAKRAADVIGIDFVDGLLDFARERAAAERLKKIHFQFGDTSAIPFDQAQFDCVLSSFGHMFAPDPLRAAAEMARVCKPGGKIGFVAWCPDGLFGKFFRLHDKFNPPVPGVPEPVLWGDPAVVRERFEPYAESFHVMRRPRIFRALSIEQWFGNMAKFLGPTVVTMAKLDADQQAEFRRELMDLMAGANQSGDGTLFAPADYLEVVMTRR